MSRDYCKGLTRQELLDMGIYSINWNRDKQEWWIDRYWYKNNSKTIKVHTHVKIHNIVAEHKYGKTKVYPKVQFGYKNKPTGIPLGRIIYVWFIGDVPDGYVVDHIDNDPFNNDIRNLQLLTVEENIRKRFIDNENVKCFNQYKNTTR